MTVVKISLGPRKIREVKARLLTGGVVVFQEGELQGKIGIPFWENQLFHDALRQALNCRHDWRFPPDLLIFQVLPDLYTALRQTLHILHGNYGRTFRWGEKRALQRALAASEELHEKILSLRRGTLTQLYRKVQRAAENIIEQVGTQPRDENKKEAIDLAAEIGKVVDKLGRVNPSAKIAQLDALRRRLEERLSTILSVEPKVVGRRQTLQTLIEICELRFAAAADFLSRLLPHLNYAYFDGYARLNVKVAFRLEQMARDIQDLDLQPFTFPAQEIVAEFQQAAYYLKKYDLNKARPYLLRSRESLKLRVIRADLESFITFLTQLIFHPNRALLTPHLTTTPTGFPNKKKRLQSVDETGFAQPVCQEALAFVVAASHQVKQGKARLLEPVKERLVEAVQHQQL